ncbi:MAG: hypothetical protein Q9168_004025 [Polycauliona sp. 1 TL-2023]
MNPCLPSDSSFPAHELQLPAMKQLSTEPDPLVRFWNETTGPWNSQRLGGEPGHTPLNPQFPQFDHRIPRHGHPLHYQYRSPRSDIGSSTTGRYPLDSGYGGSKSLGTKSVRSADQLDQSPSSQSLAGDVQDLHFYQDGNFQGPPARTGTSSSPRYSSMDVTNEAPQSPSMIFDLTCQYQSCGIISKNHSEHRKHMLRHEKPHKCDVPGCPKIDGFSTNNDLDRHKKSVHKIMPKNSTDRSFRCAAINCPKRDKIWPRLDNFRQHCLRIHPDEPCDELVRKSELDPGSAAEANEMANSSNHDAGDDEPEADYEMTECLSPTITFEHSMNMIPIQCGVDPHLQQAQHFGSLSPHSPQMPSDMPHYLPYIPQPDPDQLLQIPGQKKSSSKRFLSPSRRAFVEPGHVKEPRNSGKAPKSKPLASTKIAEQLSEELACEIAKCINLNKGQPADIQADIKSKVLLALNPSLSRKRTAQMASLRDDQGYAKKKKITCNQCPVTTARQCDMNTSATRVANDDARKHQKRHTRPYGCTFPGCSKKLGSKNDWKRHENTQHYQIETWRCHEYSESSAIGQCASIFYRREQFQGHLREKHKIGDEQYIQTQCKQHRIGRNGQGKFWCGFCQEIVELKTKGLEAWEERFRHIDDQHYKKKQTIYDWLPLDGHVAKGLMGKGDYMECGSKEDNSNDDDGAEEDSSNEEGDNGASQHSPLDEPSPGLGTEEVGFPASTAARSRGSNDGRARANRREKIWTCVSTAAR